MGRDPPRSVQVRQKADNFVPFTDQTGILKTVLVVFGIAEDQQQNLWLSIPKGIIRDERREK